MKGNILFKHSANAGDLIACLAGIRQVCNDQGRKAVICQSLDIPSDYLGQQHPVVDNDGQKVMMNHSMFDMLRPLLLNQVYIYDFVVYEGQKTHVDIDIIREQCFVNLPFGSIQQWVFMAFPDMATDLSKPWISVESKIGIDLIAGDVILVNATERYRNHLINYYFLKDFQDKLVFAGTEKEHQIFCKKWKLTFPRLIVNNFLELAQAIKSCKFLLANQSSCWNLAEAMKTPRILEICAQAPNCQAFIGEKSYGFLHQGALEYYFNKLINE